MTLAAQRPIRVLYVVGGMDRGGIETWLMHILRHIDRQRFQIDFLVHTTHKCAYDDEIRDLGSKVVPCLHPHQPLTYARNFKRILREYGPYDIVHSHVHYYNGYILRLAHQAGVLTRIAHVHTDTSAIQAQARLLRRLYFALMKWWIVRHATLSLGASRKAIANVFGSGWESEPRWRVFYCGVDLNPFREFINPLIVRAEFGIPADVFIIGHVGRFAPVKNHLFLVEIAAEVAKREPKMRLLLVGDGLLRPEVEQKIAQFNLRDRIIFAGVRPDIARIMLGAVNVFLLPSLQEGLPLVLIEAQAGGLPCIFSDIVTEEAELIKPLMQRLSLSQPASVWAEKILAFKETEPRITQAEALRLVEQSAFNIKNTIKDLEKLYLECFQY